MRQTKTTYRTVLSDSENSYGDIICTTAQVITIQGPVNGPNGDVYIGQLVDVTSRSRGRSHSLPRVSSWSHRRKPVEVLWLLHRGSLLRQRRRSQREVGEAGGKVRASREHEGLTALPSGSPSPPSTRLPLGGDCNTRGSSRPGSLFHRCSSGSVTRHRSEGEPSRERLLWLPGSPWLASPRPPWRWPPGPSRSPRTSEARRLPRWPAPDERTDGDTGHLSGSSAHLVATFLRKGIPPVASRPDAAKNSRVSDSDLAAPSLASDSCLRLLGSHYRPLTHPSSSRSATSLLQGEGES